MWFSLKNCFQFTGFPWFCNFFLENKETGLVFFLGQIKDRSLFVKKILRKIPGIFCLKTFCVYFSAFLAAAFLAAGLAAGFFGAAFFAGVFFSVFGAASFFTGAFLAGAAAPPIFVISIAV